MCVTDSQWPKNSHSRMITGIGTPSSHSRSPRPILASSKSTFEKRTQAVCDRSCRRSGRRCSWLRQVEQRQADLE